MIDDKLDRFQTMVELAPVAIALFSGPQFVITHANDRVLEYWGRKREEVMGKPLFEALPEASGQGFEELLQGVYTTGERFVAKELTVNLERNGRLERTFIDFVYEPYREADNTISGVTVVCTEITDQVIARHQIEESERRFRSLIEQAPVATCLFVGRQLRIEIANPAMIAIWGKGPQIIGQPLATVLPELEGQHFLATLDELFTTGNLYESKEGRADLVMDGQLKTYYFDYSFTPLRNGEGEVYAIMEMATDVTQQVLARQQVEESEARLREADRRKDDFLALLAHELRNPLAPIRNSLQMLTLTADGNEMVTSATQVMGRQVDQLVSLVDDLLDVSRISRGKIKLRPQLIDLNEVVLLAVEASRPLQVADGLTLTVELPAAPLYLQGDTTRLIQVVSNLLNNAAKFTPEGGHVWLTAGQEDGDILLGVRDDGIGIAPDQLEPIFELFVQADTSLERSQGGLGLGLTLVRQLVQLHGGRVRASSEGPGQGSEFSVRLPALKESPKPQPVSDTGTKPTRRRILVVDDNPDAALTLAMVLKLKGFETHTRHSGQEGLAAAESLLPEVIILDIGMPGLNGYDTCRRLRQHPWGESMWVIALTGYGQEEDKRLSLEAGFDTHLIKPVDLGALLTLLASLSSRRAVIR
jgi:PAS domain S-box-containing protein